MNPGDLGKGTVRWFGATWGAPVCEGATHIPVPVGAECNDDCDRPIEAADQGITIPMIEFGATSANRIAFHLDCWLAQVLGPMTHR